MLVSPGAAAHVVLFPCNSCASETGKADCFISSGALSRGVVQWLVFAPGCTP